MESQAMKFRGLLTEFGWWHLFLFISVLTNAAFFAQTMFTVPFLAFRVPHYCSKPQTLENISVSIWNDLNSQVDGNDGPKGNCRMYKEVYLNMSQRRFLETNFSHGEETTKCSSWNYDMSFYKNSLVKKWDLVCDLDYLISTANAIGLSGLFFGVIILGQISDRFGRKPTIICGIAVWTAASFLILIVNNFIGFVCLRFICLSMAIGTYTCQFVLFAECLNVKARAKWGNANGMGFASGLITLPGLAYLLRDWFMIQVSVSTPMVVYFLLLVIFLPESPRWLLINERFDECERILKWIIKMNRIEVSKDFDLREIMTVGYKEIMENEKLASKKHILDLVKTPQLRKRSLAMFYVWFVTAYIYLSQTLNAASFGGNMLTNFAISGAVEFPGTLLAIFLCARFGRKKSVIATMTLSALASFATILVPKGFDRLHMAFMTTSKFAMKATFPVIYTYALEVFPTPIRNVGLGASSMVSRIGSTLSPYAKEIGLLTNRHVPQIITGILATLCCFVTLLLPETSHKVLPETIEDVEKENPKAQNEDGCISTKL